MQAPSLKNRAEAQSPLQLLRQIARIPRPQSLSIPRIEVQGRTDMRVAQIAHSAPFGDAIGNQIAARAAFFREHAADVQVYVESDARLHPSLLPLAQTVVSESEREAILGDLRRCDLVTVDYSQSFRLLDLLPKLAGQGPRILFDYHGVTPPQFWHGPRESLREGQQLRGLVWFADEAVVHSEYMRRELCEATGYPIERVQVQPLWFDSTRLRDANEPPTLRQRFGLHEEKLLLFVGRLAANKRVAVLIEAVAKLKTEAPAIHAIVVGDAGDIYRSELERCQELAAKLGVTERIHFLGHVSDDELADAYRGADLFVMPSVHEGCCVPVLEAMAAGLPVIAARAAALPETIAGAGLTFTPDDAEDLARQLRRALTPDQRPDAIRRIAVVSPRYGEKVLGGAERSLRLIAEVLAEAGRDIEVFTTGPGESVLNGVRIHRLPEDNLRAQHLAPFDAIIAGPYGSELTRIAARIAPERTVAVPCYHDEPPAHDPAIVARYSQVAGILYHSDAERRLAEIDLGVTVPNSAVIGTWLGESHGNAARGRKLAGDERPYLIYCGRYCREKNLPLLIDWLKRYETEHPDRFQFVFIGEGDAQFPRSSNWKNLGFVSERDKADLLAGAAALVQLSTNESLSLAALDAWNEGTPVIAHRDCAAIREQSLGGKGVANYAEFCSSLEALWSNPNAWREIGQIGKEKVRERLGSKEQFARQIVEVLDNLNRPIAELMRECGLQATSRSDEEFWKKAFSERVESVLHRDPIEMKFAITISPRHGDRLRARPGASRVAIRLENAGTIPLMPESCRIYASVSDCEILATRIPEILLPGQSRSVLARLDVPGEPGNYVAEIAVERAGTEFDRVRIPLSVRSATASQTAEPILEELLRKLAEADSLVELPDGYTDVSEGKLASLKHRIKQKLLHQFQTAYVDVLSRQQSAMNRLLVEAIQELAECLAMLGQPSEQSQANNLAADFAKSVRQLKAQIRRMAGRLDEMEERLERLEARESIK
jgi:glycosyltransferase involved in cell wall biosynthesis